MSEVSQAVKEILENADGVSVIKPLGTGPNLYVLTLSGDAEGPSDGPHYVKASSPKEAEEYLWRWTGIDPDGVDWDNASLEIAHIQV